MKTLVTLVKREIWEHRTSFVTTPIVIGGLMIVVAICAMFVWGIKFDGTQAFQLMMEKNFKSGVSMGLFSIGLPFVIVLWFVVANYFLGCLYDDRKDRSVLFWYSMPVSQAQIIISKLIAGLIIAPIFVFLMMIVTQIVLLVLSTVELLLLGAGSMVLTLWHPSVILFSWAYQFLALVEQGVWLLPFLTWFMLSSAYAKRSPFLRAIVPIILILIIEAFFFFNHQWLFHFIRNQFSHALSAWGNASVTLAQWFGHNQIFEMHSSNSQSIILLWVGVLLSVLFAIGAGFLRKRYLEN